MSEKMYLCSEMKTKRKHFFRYVLTVFCLMVWVMETGYAQDMTSSLSYRRFTTLDGLPQMQTERVWQDSQGYIWIGTLSGFARYDGRELMPFLKGRRENIVSFAEIDGEVRALNFRRQWLVNGEKAQMRQIAPDGHWLLNNFNTVDLPNGIIILEDDYEKNRRLCRMEKNRFVTLLSDTLLDKMTPDRKIYMYGSTFYLPTEDGLFVTDQKQFRLLSLKPDVFSLHHLDKTLYALAADGIYKVDDHGLTQLAAYTFDAPDYGLLVCHDRRGRLVIADSHTLYIYDGKQVSIAADGFNMIKHLFIDRWGRIWLATYQGLYCYFMMDFTNHRLNDTNDIVRTMAIDGAGRMVSGTLNGKVLIDGKVVNESEGDFYVPGSAVVDGIVYLAGKTDIYRIENGQRSGLGLPYERYQFVAEAFGKVVFGTRQEVLSYDPSSAHVDTLSSDILHPWCAAADTQGSLWVGASTGLYHLIRKSPSAWTTQKIDYPQKLIITTLGNDSHGHIFFASGDSLFMIQKNMVKELNSVMPQLCGHEIRSLHISPKGYLLVAVIDGLFIARIDNNCAISDVHFFDHLNGFTNVEPQTSPMVESPDGTVWLMGLEEATSFLPAHLMDYRQEDMFIAPPKKWWQRWWVWLIAASLLAIVVWLIARRHERKRNRRALLALQREKMQKELQINAIRLKSIPHFNSNVISGIEYFVMNHSVEEASYYLGLYSKFTNSTLIDIDRPARSVEEEVEYVKNYLQLEKMRYGDKLSYSIHVDKEVPPQTLLPNMLLHTYCQNAIKHGISPKEGPGKVMINISKKTIDSQQWIVVRVSDDGIGREAAAALNTDSTKRGLSILMEQITLHNQTNSLPICQHVTDLTDSEGLPVGTCYEMEIPVEYKYE